MLPSESSSKGTSTCLIALCALSARWALIAAFAAVLVFSSGLSLTFNPFHAAHSSHKAPHCSLTKAKAVSTAAEPLSSTCRAAHRRVSQRPTHLSILSPSPAGLMPIFRPLRC
jgi:hypothetical protein